MQSLPIRARLIGPLAAIFGSMALGSAFLQATSERIEAREPEAHFESWTDRLQLGPGVDLAGRNLRGMRLAEASLVGAIFDGCDLAGAHFGQCGFTKASFRGARLTGAEFDGCTIEGTDFSDAVIENMVHDDETIWLTPEQLESTRSYKTKQLENCRIRCDPSDAGGRFDFRGANLRRAWLSGDLVHTDLTDADIRGTVFQAYMRFDQLASTKSFQDGRLQRVVLFGFIRGKQDYSGIIFDRVSIAVRGDCRFDDTRFVGRCSIIGHFDRNHLAATRNYKQGDLSGIDFGQIDLTQFDLSGMNLTGCRFGPSCKLDGTDFTDAVITGVEFQDRAGGQRAKHYGLTFEQIQSTWNYKHDRMDGVILPESMAATVRMEAAAKKLPGGDHPRP